MKKNNLRTCIITKKKLSKEELIRFVIIDNEIILDLENKIKARGYYIFNSKENINRIKEHKILEKKFKISELKNFYEKLI